MTLKKCLAAVVLGALQILPATAQDWSGWYAGASLESNVNSTWDFSFEGAPISSGDFNSETSAAVFGGYNLQRGKLVYGGEIAFSPTKLGITPTSHFESALDLKGRVGYASGRALIYGVLGYTWADYVDGAATSTLKHRGLNYGVGVDYQITDHLFAGAEYLMRDLNADFQGYPGIEMDTSVRTLSLRVGMTF